ncbi:MAG: hypothetical protein K6E26_10350 [Clostridiales bacterium]|nr:hypothetical protein [Clostridiales bacterium]
MKKRLLASLASFMFILNTFAGTGSAEPTDRVDPTDVTSAEYGNGSIEIIAYSPSGEFSPMLQDFFVKNPDLNSKYKVISYRMADPSGNTYDTLCSMLDSKDKKPDLYISESGYAYDFINGKYADYAADYSDFIDNLDSKIKKAELARYSVEMGTDKSSHIKALSYQSTLSLFYYRRSIAKEVFGTDDPDSVMDEIGGGTGKWDKFLEACEKMKSKGYAMVSSTGDLWNASVYGSETPWVVDDTLRLDPERATFMDLAKIIEDNDYSNHKSVWSYAWYADMNGTGLNDITKEPREVFSFLGPTWFLYYVIAPQNASGTYTYGDWGACLAPVSFSWGGYCVSAAKKGVENSSKKEFISRFVEWITLDTSDTGYQFGYASGLYTTDGTKEAVVSGNVLEKADGSSDMLAGQDPYPYIKKAGSLAPGSYMIPRDYNSIDADFLSSVDRYVSGKLSREEAFAEFQDNIASYGGIDVKSQFVVPDPVLTAPDALPSTVTPTPVPTQPPATPTPTVTPAPTDDTDVTDPDDPSTTTSKAKKKKSTKKKVTEPEDPGKKAIIPAVISVIAFAAVCATVVTIVYVKDNKKKRNQSSSSSK